MEADATATAKVELYIFDISQGHGISEFIVETFLKLTGRPIIHSGVIVHNKQFQYGPDGVDEFEVDLRRTMINKYDMGFTKYSLEEIREHLAYLSQQDRWQKTSFDAINNNAHHFSEELLRHLCGDDAVLPEEVSTFLKKIKKFSKNLNQYY